jgi:aminoglycoside 3-N-acetyltransferase
MLASLLSRLPPAHKRRLRAVWHGARERFAATFLSYGPEQMVAGLRDMGVAAGDSLMVHAGFRRDSGFRGSPSMMVRALQDAVGPQGHLVMVSMPYLSSAYQYFSAGRTFDVRRTVSHMGIVSETFRRSPGVLRSLHPANPLLVRGPRAAWVVAGHEDCLYPCGPGSPFERLAQMDARVLFIDVSLHNFTFFHYLEQMVEDKLEFPLFRDDAMDVPVIDHDGRPGMVRTRVFSAEAIKRRRLGVLLDELDRQHLVRRRRVGNSRLAMLDVGDSIRVTQELLARGVVFYA